MRHILSFLKLVSDSRITALYYLPPSPVEIPVIGIQWCVSIGNVCFVTDIVGMN